MNKCTIVSCAALVAGAVFAGAAMAEISYKDKTVRIVVGSPPGGMLDTYSRAISRHMGKHLPGRPAIIIDNKAGAGTLLAANYLFKAARPDGLTFGTFIGNLVLSQIFGEKGIEFDARRFEWIGTAQRATAVCVLTKASGIASVEQWEASRRQVKLGGTGLGSNTDDIPKIVGASLGLPLQIVSGYKGTAAIRQAAESGEVDGLCASWEILKVSWSNALTRGDVNVVLQVTEKAHPDLPRVTVAFEHAKNSESRQLIQLGVVQPAQIIQPYAAPPGTPPEIVEVLRKAFMATMKDSEFLADAEKAKLSIDPMSGEQVEKVVSGYFKLDPQIVAKLKQTIR
ncbi:MAG TPA: tripartite tricarboxylate transporter substrate-binding protein [Candidatus Eisenbacteria bacterium]|nr:tripartite tricarboxylate transporter substrate-binding protein [Candidatus Eisenbacteria bacterium]